jgi:type I pantothenate kinase
MKPNPLYHLITREQWKGAAKGALPITEAEFERLRGLNDPIPFKEVEEVYLPLTELILLYVEAAQQLKRAAGAHLSLTDVKVPFIIGIAGSVAVGKSTVSRLLKVLLARSRNHPSVDLVTTDGFLYPNRVLEERGIMNRKGFPESYHIRKLLQFLSDVKSGKPEVAAPVYSHLYYDILPDEYQVVRSPDILIVEGINVLQVNKQAPLFVSDFFDLSIYVDADERDIERWYVERFLMLRDTAFRDPSSYFHRYADLSEQEAVDTARRIWREINAVNLHENILPTRGRARIILVKGPDHAVRHAFIRKL